MNPSTDAVHATDNTKHSPEKSPLRYRQRRQRILFLLSVFVIASLGLFVVLMRDRISPVGKAKANDVEHSSEILSVRKVKVIKPKSAAELSIFAEQMSIVEPYYRADLRARASGIVRRVDYEIGDSVNAGDVLVEIDVPELEQDVARADKSIDQRKQELKVAQAKLKDAVAAKRVSFAAVKQKKADVQGLTASRDLRKAKLVRYKELSQRGTVVGSVVEEEERDYLAAEGALLSAMAAVEKAEADLSEMDSKIEAAEAEIDLRNVMIEVAQKELERAQAIANNARIFAPFEGTVVQRSIDPGSFVQNASTGSSETLISIAKTDVVTISARFPDSVAPYVSVGNSCDVFIDDMGLLVHAEVSRFSPIVQTTDRTIRVEVDLFNGTSEEVENSMKSQRANGKDRQIKGLKDKLPTPAFVSSETNRRIIPGMTGRLRLKIAGFGQSFLLPSTAIYSRTGRSYILLVQNNKTQEQGVRIQFSDGQTSRVSLISEVNEFSTEKITELTGEEVVVMTKQLEVGRDRDVEIQMSDW